MHSGSEPIKVLALWLMGLMVVLVGAAMTIAFVNARVFGPERMVEEYFSALKSGESAKALGLLGAEVPEGNGLMLSPEAVRASSDAIEHLEVTQTRSAEGKATVDADFEVDGETHQTTFELVRTGRQWLFFTTWELEMKELPTATVVASNTGDIKVNGLDSPLDKGAQTFPVLPPAVLDSSFEQRFFQAEAKRTVVAGPTSLTEPVVLTAQPTQDLLDEVTKQIRAYVDSCTEQQVLMPTGCPLTYDTEARVDPDTIDWEVTEYPEVELAGFDGSWVLRPLEMDVQLTLEERSLATGEVSKVSLEQSYGFSAQLEVGADKVLVTPVATQQ